jgi:hypothetical protein
LFYYNGNIYLLESLPIDEQIDQLLNTYQLKDTLIFKHPIDSLILPIKKTYSDTYFYSAHDKHKQTIDIYKK